MLNAKNILVAVLILVGFVGSVEGATIYSTGTSGSGTIHALAAEARIHSCTYTTMNFTLDGEFLEDVWAIILSDIEGEYVLNGYGYSADYGPGAVGFRFVVFGNADNPYVASSIIIPIINDDDPELFMISAGGVLTIGLGEDEVLGQENLSIDGGAFGDISSIVFDESDQGDHSLDSVALVTPEPATMALLGLGGIGLLSRRKRNQSRSL